MQIIDAHTHIFTPASLPFLRGYLERAGVSGLLIAAMGCDGNGCAAEQNLLPLLFKRQEPRFYAYGSLLYPETPVTQMAGEWAPETQARTLVGLGVDGIKLLEGKPGERRKTGLALDGPVYEPFFRFLEDSGVPVLWHVADPPTFWDINTAPDFAVKAGWTYDGGYPTFAQINDEVFHVLERHPRLSVTLAHFFFRSDSAAEAQRVLDAYPAVGFDITPGIEMYENFSRDPETWRAFFLRNASRLRLGTDADEYCSDVMCETEKKPELTLQHVRRFLETGDAFRFWERPVRGLGLPEDAVSAIYAGNFMRLHPNGPRRVSEDGLCAYAAAHLAQIRDGGTREWVQRELAL